MGFRDTLDVKQETPMKTLSPLEASVLTSVVSSPERYTAAKINRLLPRANEEVQDLLRYALQGQEALKGKPDEYRREVTGLVDSIKRWVALKREEAAFEGTIRQHADAYRVATSARR